MKVVCNGCGREPEWNCENPGDKDHCVINVAPCPICVGKAHRAGYKEATEVAAIMLAEAESIQTVIMN